LRYRWNLKNWK